MDHAKSITTQTNVINKKKYLMEQQKNAQIQRQNRILFQKINSQATKSYYKGTQKKNRSSKTLNSNDDSDDNEKKSRKYQNWSQNKISSGQQQSRISFQESQQMMRPKLKIKPTKMKMITQLSPQIIDLLKSRMIESRTIQSKEQENVLFQGVGQIDTIKFKVKICIKNNTYFLTGKNKHTQIMLKMEINEYKKFHKQVLKGNPSNIFNFLKIDKGQIRFRTRQQEQEQIKLEEQKNKKRIYQIEEQEEDQEYNNEVISYPKGFQRSTIQKAKKVQQLYNHARSKKQKSSEQISNNYEKRAKTRQKPYKNQQIYDQNELQNDIIKKITIYNNNNQKYAKNIDRAFKTDQLKKQKKYLKNVNPEQIDKITKIYNYNTLEDYVNDNNNGNQVVVTHEQSHQRQGKLMRDRYKLPYL